MVEEVLGNPAFYHPYRAALEINNLGCQVLPPTFDTADFPSPGFAADDDGTADTVRQNLNMHSPDQRLEPEEEQTPPTEQLAAEAAAHQFAALFANMGAERARTDGLVARCNTLFMVA